MIKPTPQEIENASARAAIAERQNAEYAEAERLALAALGPGWKPWMKLYLVDADHRRSGDTRPVAVAYKVYRGEERLSERSRFVRRMPGGSIRQAETYEPLFAELLAEKHPTYTVEVKGRQVPVGRWELCWAALERYEPKTAEELAAARQKREARALEREAEATPLFAEQIRAEGLPGRQHGMRRR